jgi:hypothetical protein
MRNDGMGRIGRWAGALTVAVVAGAALCGAGGVAAAIVKTKISLADFEKAYNLSYVARLIDPNKRDNVSFHIRRFDKKGVPVSKSGRKVDPSKSFIVFAVERGKDDDRDRVRARMLVDVRFKPSSRRRDDDDDKLARLSCGLRGGTAVGIRSVKCGRGPKVSPT